MGAAQQRLGFGAILQPVSSSKAAAPVDSRAIVRHREQGGKSEVGKALTKDIQAAIHKLPEIFRNPFLLYFDGFKYHEIAEMLQEPLGTIKSRIHFARKLLKTQIQRF